MVPFTGAGSSTVTLSVSSITTMSSCLTASPTLFSHSPISTSVTDSPTEGTFNSTGTLASPSDHGAGACTATAHCEQDSPLGITAEVTPAGSLLRSLLRSLPSERSRDEFLLLEPVRAGRTRRGARRLVARGARERMAPEQTLTKPQPQERPRAHVL